MSYSSWLLADLQVHTPADKNHRYGQAGGPEPNDVFARKLLAAHRDAGVRIIAVTDHNTIAWWPILDKIGSELGVFVFPGLEININRCHLMAIWDRTEKGFDLAQRYLAGLFDAGTEPLEPNRTPRPVLKGSILDQAKSALEMKALVLAPHSTASTIGLFGKGVCNISSKVAKSGFVSGFDVIGNTGADVLKNPRTEFGDRRPPWFSSGDLRSLEDVGKRACYLKVSPEPTLESLRQAFLMPETRVRLRGEMRTRWKGVKGAAFLDSPEPGWDRIGSVAVKGGFHDGLKLDFGPGLNAVIGGKGTGKSTLIEILRFVLEAPDSIAPRETVKDGKGGLRANFSSNAEAEVGYRAADGDAYEVRRVGGNSQAARLFRDGTQLELDPQRRVRLRVFGQRELAELPAQPGALVEFVLGRSAADSEKASAEEKKRLEAAREIAEELDELDDELADNREAEEELSDLNDRLKQVVKAGAANVAQESEKLQQADAKLSELFEWPAELLEQAEPLLDHEPPELPKDAPLPPGIKSTRRDGATAVTNAAKELVSQIRAFARALAEHAEAWESSRNKKSEKIARLLADAGLDDPAEFGLQQARKAELERGLRDSKTKQAERKKLLPKRAKAIEELGEARRARSRLIEAAVDDLNERTGRRVQIIVDPLSDLQPLIDFLGEEVTERKLTPAQISPLKGLSGADLAEAAFSKQPRADLEALGLTASLVDLLEECEGECLRRLEEVEKPDVVRIEVNLAEKGAARWTDVNDASPGQAATAMLELALIASDEPLLIDQPEDDLDNRFIYDEVVKRLAEVGASRQIIVATHNANIPVLGDAELILAFDASTDKGEVIACGGLDEVKVAETAREILEGGEEAFDARARRYAT
jgi:DNA repair ATPase RecN